MKKLLLLITSIFISNVNYAQNSSYWQQHVDYKMDVNVNVKDYTYKGTQKLTYTNNSPDELNKVFYHLYYNAFQPGSEMDERSRSISDPDKRVGDRISKLKEDEVGFIHVKSLTQNGKGLKYKTVGTVLEVKLNTPIRPGEQAIFDMKFDAQIPVQIRRTGRDNKEGVALSMTQWYPKLAEYDFEGWHAHPYIGREFHGVWGNFDVKITLDKTFTVGGTGYLQNPNDVGHGYETEKLKKQKGKTLTWHFVAPNVHDFTWGADPKFIHDTREVTNGPTLHFLYKDNNKIKDNWKKLQPETERLINYYSEYIGKYPYNQYSVIQGGDGGMEYAMCTLITGERSFSSLVGVTAHEIAHTWFQFLLATNESKHEWMDEGFTSYISDKAMNYIEGKTDNPFKSAYSSYFYLVGTGKEQPQTTHADHYHSNMAYGIAAYSKGEVFLSQLGYVIGEDNLKKTLKLYFDDFSFKHPTPVNFIRCAEKVSGLELDWYLNDWTQTTNTIDYAIKSVKEKKKSTEVTIKREGDMPMPLDIAVKLKNGDTKNYYIPLRVMRGERPLVEGEIVLEDSAWAIPYYTFNLDYKKEEIETITIDPLLKMADIDSENNKYKN